MDDNGGQQDSLRAWEELFQEITSAARSAQPDVYSFWRCIDVAHANVPAPRPAVRYEAVRRFRGYVAISARWGAMPGKTISVVCSVDSEHLVLLGDSNYEVPLARIQFDHLAVIVRDDAHCSFGLKIREDFTYGQDTLIILSVTNTEQRDLWLSVLLDRRVQVTGWERRACNQLLKSGKGNFLPLVTWLS